MIVAAAPARRADLLCHAVEAMGTRFEVVLPDARHQSGADVHAIAEEALAEITRLDARLSVYQPTSDVSWINAHAAQRDVKVEPRLFALLQRCVELSEATDGAFDITMGPLIRAWKFMGDTGAFPTLDAVAGARTRVGYEHLRLDPGASTIRFARAGMAIDLGAVGKGFAIDQAIGVLRAHGVTRALLHGGTSSVHAIGRPSEGNAWRIAWRPGTSGAKILEVCNSALSVSAQHGKSFVHAGRRYGHVIHPCTGWPVDVSGSTVVTGPRSLECDALSTALLVNGTDWLRVMRARFPDYDGLAG